MAVPVAGLRACVCVCVWIGRFVLPCLTLESAGIPVERPPVPVPVLPPLSRGSRPSLMGPATPMTPSHVSQNGSASPASPAATCLAAAAALPSGKNKSQLLSSLEQGLQGHPSLFKVEYGQKEELTVLCSVMSSISGAVDGVAVSRPSVLEMGTFRAALYHCAALRQLT
jgi:hypothetical protein